MPEIYYPTLAKPKSKEQLEFEQREANWQACGCIMGLAVLGGIFAIYWFFFGGGS